MIAHRLAQLSSRIDAACQRSGRPRDPIRLVAVSKKFPARAVKEAWTAGLVDFGENYAQEMLQKQSELADLSLRWHFIGALQTNKVKQLVGRVFLFHAVDSQRLIAEIAKRFESGTRPSILLAVSLAGEAQKTGAKPDELPELLASCAECGIECLGLMTMPPLPKQPEDSRVYYRRLRELRDRVATAAAPLPELSMGTSGDVEVAVEEGATLIRVGQALFGPRPVQR